MPRVPVLGSTNALRRGEVKVKAFGYKALVRHVRVDEPLAEGPHQVEREKGGIKVPRVLCYVESRTRDRQANFVWQSTRWAIGYLEWL